jgi:hypothetical protein
MIRIVLEYDLVFVYKHIWKYIQHFHKRKFTLLYSTTFVFSRMFNCPVCDTSFEKRKNVDTHLARAHPEQKTPYNCVHCTSTFASAKAAKHHAKRHALDEDLPDRKRQCLSFIGTLSEWVRMRYNPSRETVAEHLAPSTVSRIEAFHRTLRFEENQTLEQIISLVDDGVIVELIDNWLDHQVELHSMQTVNNHVRHLKVLLMFLQEQIDSPDVKDYILEYIIDLVADTQTTTTRATTTLNMLKLEDPFALAAIRDLVVNALLKEQVEYIHPYMMSSIGTDKHVDFGIRLRNWLELAIRFTNIPCRIQCTRELQMPDVTNSTYVAKLIAREGQLCRMVNNDKNSSSHQPLLLPLGRSLSVYLFFYMTHCRPDSDHSFVFCTRRGTKWTRPSRDLKRYIEGTLEIPVHEIDPTGRFIHGSRAVMMAVFALGVHFDQQKMHGFARLMRHSSTTNERFYSMWQNRALSNQAIDVFSNVMGLDFTSETQTPAMYQPVRLREVPPQMMSVFQQEFSPTSNIVPCYGTRSIGTQTGDERPAEIESVLQEINVSDTQPRCVSCGLFTLELYGPFGSMRRKRYVGRYYLACNTCHRNEDGRFVLHKCLWYPIGYVPIQKSQSSRPRNMLDIQTYIESYKL